MSRRQKSAKTRMIIMYVAGMAGAAIALGAPWKWT
jgi:hypothetical protein